MGWIDDWGIPPNNATRPAHSVKLSGFYMQKTEVTNGEFEHYLQERGPGLQSCPEWKSRFDKLKVYLGEEQASKLPAVGISWQDAENYAEAMGGRLPTEAQWEFAARSRGKPHHHVWDHKGILRVRIPQLANIENQVNLYGAAAVASYPEDETAQGVRDLTGNVQEWCRDAWKLYEPGSGPVADPQTKPDSPGQSVVIRGGSFQTEIGKGHTTHREARAPGNVSSPDLGFRVVIEGPEGPPDKR